MSRVYEEAGPEQWLAVCAWVSSGSHVTEGTGDLPSISDFEERFCGRWARFRDYAEDLADQAGLAAGWPETATSSFNWDACPTAHFTRGLPDRPRARRHREALITSAEVKTRRSSSSRMTLMGWVARLAVGGSSRDSHL